MRLWQYVGSWKKGPCRDTEKRFVYCRYSLRWFDGLNGKMTYMSLHSCLSRQPSRSNEWTFLEDGQNFITWIISSSMVLSAYLWVIQTLNYALNFELLKWLEYSEMVLYVDSGVMFRNVQQFDYIPCTASGDHFINAETHHLTSNTSKHNGKLQVT